MEKDTQSGHEPFDKGGELSKKFSAKAEIAKSIDSLRTRKARYENIRLVLRVVGLALIGYGLRAVLLYLNHSYCDEVGGCGVNAEEITMIFWGTILLLLPGGPRTPEELCEEIELQELTLSGFDEFKDKADYLFRSHQRDLKRYYDQILQQNSRIFFVGITCLSFGIAIAFYVLRMIGKTDYLLTQKDIVLASFGAVSSISINFVGALYLRMFTSISKSTGEFHRRLVSTHNIHFANLFASQLEQESERAQAIKDIINGLVKSFVLNASSTSGEQGGSENSEGAGAKKGA